MLRQHYNINWKNVWVFFPKELQLMLEILPSRVLLIFLFFIYRSQLQAYHSVSNIPTEMAAIWVLGWVYRALGCL